MGKPLGIGIRVTDGVPHLYPTPIDRLADQIWDVVRAAICANMTPEQFKREAAQAWGELLREDAKAAQEELLK